MTMGNWKRISRTFATALLAGSLTVGTVSAIAPVLSPQPVAAAVATTQYPQLGFNYGDNRATIYVDPTNFTADQLTAIRQGISNVQGMLAGIFTFTMTNNRSQADIIYVGYDFSNTATNPDGRSGDTNVNYNRVSNHIAQHPNGTEIRLDDSYRSFIGSPNYYRLPPRTNLGYQDSFNYSKAVTDKYHYTGTLMATEHELGHAIGLDHAPVDTYGATIMNPNGGMDSSGDMVEDLTKDLTYIRSVQAIYGGQAIALGELDVKQPTQGYHSSNAGNSGNSGNAGNSGNNNNSGNTGNTGNSGSNSNSGNTGNTGNGGNSGNSGNAGNSGTGTSTQNNTVKSARGNVYIGKSAGAEVYSDPNFANDTGKKLPFNTNWKGFAIVYDAAGNPVGFNVGGQQYIKFSDGGFAYYTDNKIRPISGVFTIHVPDHPTWGTAFYNDAMQAKGILRAGSKWRVFAYKAFDDGKEYYNLGGNQWIRADYGSLN